MFFRESELLAHDHPEQLDIIRKVDDLLHSTGPSGLFDPKVVSSMLNERPSQISGIFIELERAGLLKKYRYIECPYCNNLMDIVLHHESIGDRANECTQCERILDGKILPERLRYRLNSGELFVSKKNQDRLVGKSNKLANETFPSILRTDPFKNTHLLRYYSTDPKLSEKMPFQGKRVLMILHFLRDLVPFVEALVKLGLDVRNSSFFYKAYPYPQKEEIKIWLEEKGAIVEPHSNIQKHLQQLADTPNEKIGDILIIEDGGFIGPSLHLNFSNLIDHTIGSIEQTTRGIRNAEKIANIRFPIISVATSRLKEQFEPPFIARASLSNIGRLLPNLALSGKKIAIFGYGTIGRQLASELRDGGSNVTVFDVSPENSLMAKQNGFNVADSVAEAAQDKAFIFGASGNESINSEAIAKISNGTFIVSMSSELYEIDMEELSRQAIEENDLMNDQEEVIGTEFILPRAERAIKVLANGYPINFWGFESMPEEASDLILSLILLSAAELAIGNYRIPKINSDAVNEIASRYKVAKKFSEFH